MKFLEAEAYQPKVSQRYEELAQVLAIAFPSAHIEHIGSSSVEGLVSKGDLDIYLSVPLENHSDAVNKLEEMGYVVKEDTHRDDELCMMILPDQEIDTAIQIVAKGSRFENFLDFKYSLQSNPLLREEYNQLKRDSASLDEESYRLKKAAFIEKVLKSRE